MCILKAGLLLVCYKSFMFHDHFLNQGQTPSDLDMCALCAHNLPFHTYLQPLGTLSLQQGHREDFFEVILGNCTFVPLEII